MGQRPLLIIVAACVALFALVSLVAATDYPEWAWIFVFVGLLGSVGVGAIALVLLLWGHLRGERAGA